MLYANTNPAAFVEQSRRSGAGATAGQPSDGIEPDPLAFRLTFDVHGDVRVDEHPLVERQRRADSVAGVGSSDEALYRRRRLPSDDRLQQSDPREGRAGLEPGTTGIAHLAAMRVKGLEGPFR